MHDPTKLAAVAAGQIDAAFVRAATPTAGIVLHPLWNEPLHAALPAVRAPRHSGDPVDLRALADLPLARSRQEDNPGVFDLITVACEAAGIDPPSGPTLGSVQDLLVAHVAAARCWTLLYASTPDAVVPHDVVLTATRPAMHVTTALAVPANPRRPLLDDLLTAAGVGGEG